MYDMPSKRDMWVDNPYIEGSRDMRKILHPDLYIPGIAHAKARVQSLATMMPPFEAQRLAEWAKIHPTADPRMYVPLAQYGVDPMSPEALAAVEQDVINQVGTGQYGAAAGTPNSAITSASHGTAAPAATDTEDDGGFFGFLGDVWHGTTGYVFGANGEDAPSLWGATKTLWRAELTGLAAPYQAMVAGGRNVGGSMDRKNELTDLAMDRFDLSDDTIEQMKVSGRFWEKATFDPSIMDADELARAKAASEWIDKKMGAYEEQQPGVVAQTEAGQVIASYRDDQPGNLLTARPEDGSVYDPKTQKWYNPKTKQPAKWVTETGILPSQYAATQSAWEAVKSWDITTAEERANGVAPTAWTPGRGVAHIWWSPDETAFSVASGLVDTGVSLFGDPVNLIPAGKVGSWFRGSTKAGRALMGAGDDIVVLTRGARRAGTTTLTSPAALVREGARGPEASRLIREGAEVALDPYLAQRGADIIPQGAGVAPKVGYTIGDDVEGVINNTTGQVFLPHARYVMNKYAWQWLQSGRGARIVEELAGQTSISKIIERSNGNFNVGLATRLANASSPEEVRAVLGEAMGVDITRVSEWGALGGRAPAIARLPLGGRALARQFDIAGKELVGGAGIVTKRGRSKMAQNYANFGALGAVRSLYRGGFRVGPVSGGGFDLDSPDDVYQEVKAFVDGARMWDESMYPKMDALLTARNGAERYNLIYGSEGNVQGSILHTVQTKLSEEFGIPDEVAKKITRAFAGGLNPRERMYANSGLSGDVAFGAKADGIGDALLLGEMLSSHAVLPDYRTMRRATGVLSKIYKLPDAKAAEAAAMVLDGMNGLTSVWRSATLIRGAYVLREIGEMAYAMSLAGSDGMFTHPFQFLANATTAAAMLELSTGPAKMFQKLVTAPGQAGQFVIDRAGRVRIAYGGRKALTSLDEHIQTRMADAISEDVVGLGDMNALRLQRALQDVANESESGAYRFRDLTRLERMQVAKAIDKDALREYLLTQRGFRALFPAFDPRWARVNGLSMFHEMNGLTTGELTEGRVTLPAGQRAMNISSGYLGVDEPAAREASRYIEPILKTDEAYRRRYVRAHIQQRLMPLVSDQTMRALADEEQAFDDVFAWWHGTTTQELQFSMRPSLMAPVAPGSLIPTEESAREYLYGYQRMLQGLVGDDPELLRAVHTGKFEGEPISPQNTALVNYIETKMADDADFFGKLPDTNLAIPNAATLASPLRRFANWFFQTSGEFSDIFGRAPLMRKAYTDRVLTLAPHMTNQAKWHAVRNLREAGDFALAKRLAKVKTRKTATLGIDEVEAVAQGYARSEMERLFYNAHKRQNWALAMRVAAPFAQATMNTFKRWGMFSFAHPQMLYRTMKPIEALTDPDSAVIYEVLGSMFGDENMQSLYTPGRPDLSVDGFFFHNEYGDRLFAYPAIGSKLANLIPGVNVPEGIGAVAPWQNLNVAGTSFNPGTGPLITFGASMLASDQYYKDSPAGTFLRWLAPYGLPTDENDLMRALRSFMPSSLNRSFPREDQQATLLINLYQAELNSGQYDPGNPADQRRAMDAAKAAQSAFNWMSGLGGSFLPATFQWEQYIDTSQGQSATEGKAAIQMLMIQSKLKQEFDKYTEPQTEETSWEDYKRGMYQFYLDYGRSALMSVLPRTDTLGDAPVSPITDTVWQFRSEHPDVYNQYRDVIPLFFPGGDPHGEFSKGQENMYGWQKQTGDRYVPDLEVWAKEADSQIGWMLYGVQQSELMKRIPDEETRSPYLEEIRQNIKAKFPGWNPEQRSQDFEGNINLLREATNDEDIAALPGAEQIRLYLDARERAIDEVQWGMGTSGDLTTDAAAPVRAQLFAYASSLVRQDPSGTFSYAWARFLSQEFEEE